MTNELEKQFFDTFGIKPKYKTYIFKYCPYKKEYDCENCDNREWRYPQITDRILLELICLTGNTGYFLINNEGSPIDVKGLKNSVLHTLIIYSKFHKDLKHKVQELFMEGI